VRLARLFAVKAVDVGVAPVTVQKARLRELYLAYATGAAGSTPPTP